MTIDEAIENLEHKVSQNVFQVDPDAFIALKLGIEALKRIQRLRVIPEFESVELLPGETKAQERRSEMNIPEAIEVLVADEADDLEINLVRSAKAKRLGIEALKLYKDLPLHMLPKSLRKLIGETKD